MYITFNQFVERHSWPTLHALRCIYYDALKKKNSFNPAFSKVGRRLLVDPDKFFKIVEDYGSDHQAQPSPMS